MLMRNCKRLHARTHINRFFSCSSFFMCEHFTTHKRKKENDQINHTERKKNAKIGGKKTSAKWSCVCAIELRAKKGPVSTKMEKMLIFILLWWDHAVVVVVLVIFVYFEHDSFYRLCSMQPCKQLQCRKTERSDRTSKRMSAHQCSP